MPMLRWARNAGRQSDVDSPKTLVRVASIFEDVEADRTELNDFAYWVLVFDDADVCEGFVGLGRFAGLGHAEGFCSVATEEEEEDANMCLVGIQVRPLHEALLPFYNSLQTVPSLLLAPNASAPPPPSTSAVALYRAAFHYLKPGKSFAFRCERRISGLGVCVRICGRLH
jgi:hypothetical protein